MQHAIMSCHGMACHALIVHNSWVAW